MKLKHDSNGFSPLEIIIAIVVLLAIGFSSWFFIQARNNKTENKAVATPSSASAQSGTVNAVKAPDGKALNSVAETQTESSTNATAQPANNSLSFVDTNGWVERTSPDGKYSVKLSPQHTYGSCNKNDSTLFVGVVILSANNDYNCSTPQDVVAVIPNTEPHNMVMSRVVFAESSRLWDRQNATSRKVTLANGQAATRYEYQNVVSGKTFYNVEYATSYNGTDYIAINHWEVSFDNEQYGVPTNVFDTIVQQTWEFN